MAHGAELVYQRQTGQAGGADGRLVDGWTPPAPERFTGEMFFGDCGVG